MRSLSGTRNRIVLTVAALVTLAVAAWLIAVSFALLPAGSSLSGLMVPADSTVDTLVQEHQGWALPAATTASVLALLVGLGLLLAQIPSAPEHTTLRLHDDGTPLASLEPQVLERALAERVEGVPGVDEASVRVSGSTTSLRILAEVSVSEDAQVEWAVAEARRVLATDPETALGTSPLSVDLLVRVRTPRSSSRTDRVAVRHGGAGGDLVSEPA
ncbi:MULTISPECIES: hypothetical protein [unclassified Dietzia]|uniref:hypothetical protein n=1 Tax=unclassified Dietzia TaxID=2617939 RepID=UPI000D22C83A|nr:MULTISPECIES: hypothetical protein [unclassified Dietzia]AVZ40241.1 hypothetical protein CT688_12965 [Dietzia sp. JS16-p6b]QGW25705.1 hypothetical protein GJR88_04117 [Dietzia sp. DQ12-45-1b]